MNNHNHNHNQFVQTTLPPEYYVQPQKAEWAFVFYDWGSWIDKSDQSKASNQLGAKFHQNLDPTGLHFVGQIRWKGYGRMLNFYCVPERWLELKNNLIDFKSISEQDDSNSGLDPDFELDLLDIDLDLDLGLNLDENCQLISWRNQVSDKLLNSKTQEQEDFEKIWISILKSHLQKSIRRGKTSSAIATINEFLVQGDPIALFRRLPVIVIEDTYLFNDYPILIWLMGYYSLSNTKQQKLISQTVIKWLYNLIDGLCQMTPWKDPYPTFLDQPDLVIGDDDVDQIINEEEKDIIYSLWLRIGYGGMKGDMIMFNRYARKWWEVFSIPNINRTNDSESIFEFKRLKRSLWQDDQNNLDEKLTFRLKYDHEPTDLFIPESLDFHPLPGLIWWLMNVHPKWDENQLKTSIWYCASSVNYRESNVMIELDSKITSCWDDVKTDFFRYGHKFWTDNSHYT